MSFCFRRVSEWKAFQDLLGILLKLKFLFLKKLQILKNKKPQCNKGNFSLKVHQEQSKYQAGFWMCTANAEGTRRSKRERWDAILTMKNFAKKGHHYYFCCYWFAIYHCRWLFCQFIDSLQLICFFLIFQFLIPFKKNRKEWTTDNKSNNNVMSLFSFKAGGQILLEQRELQRAFKAWKDALAQSI